MRGERFEIEYLAARSLQGPEQSALAGAGEPAHDAPSESRRQRFQCGHNGSPVGLVAATETAYAPAHLGENVGEGTTALTAPPAIEQGMPCAWTVDKPGLNMSSNVRADECCSDLFGIEGRDLFVDRANAGALGIIEHRAVYRAGNMVFRELRLGAYVDQLVKFGQLCYGNDRWFTHRISRRLALSWSA